MIMIKKHKQAINDNGRYTGQICNNVTKELLEIKSDDSLILLNVLNKIFRQYKRTLNKHYVYIIEISIYDDALNNYQHIYKKFVKTAVYSPYDNFLISKGHTKIRIDFITV